MRCAMIDGKRYLFANGYKMKRRYFKTVPEKTKTFSQPTLSSNGTMGGSAFACSASSEDANDTAPGNAYHAFDNNSSTYWRCNNTTSGWIQFYSPDPLRVSKIKWGYFFSYPTKGTVKGSNDGSSWATLKSWTNSSAADFTITISSTVGYKYHRVTVTGVNKDVVHCAKMTVTAIEVTQEAYEVEVQEGEAYDRYQDDTYLEIMGVIA